MPPDTPLAPPSTPLGPQTDLLDFPNLIGWPKTFINRKIYIFDNILGIFFSKKIFLGGEKIKNFPGHKNVCGNQIYNFFTLLIFFE